MRAVVLHGTIEPRDVRVEERAIPRAGAGQVVVRLTAAALNHRDLFIVRGQYAGLRYPLVPGSDGVGLVAEVGNDVDGLVVGERVVIDPCLGWGDDPHVQRDDFKILGLPDDGTFAEYVVVPVQNVYAAPAALSDDEVAALPLAGMTAYRALVTRGNVQPGETVLVTGIGGGVSTFVLLIAMARGARVIVTSGREEKVARALSLGAVAGYDYRDEGWVDRVRAATEGLGPDLVIDGTGGKGFDRLLQMIRPGGRVVTYGATTGPIPEFAIRRVFWKGLDLRGSTMGSPTDFRLMLSVFERGDVRPIVDRVFPLEEAGAALQHMSDAAQMGKIVLRIAPYKDR